MLSDKRAHKNVNKLRCSALFVTARLSLNTLIYLQFLGDEETVKKAMEAVAAQGKAKKWTMYLIFRAFFLQK